MGHQHLPDAALWVVLSIKACLYEQGRPTLPRRSSSFTTAGSPDSRSSAPDSFTLGSLATDRQTAAGRATAGASALGSTRQHGSSSSLDTTAAVQGSPGTSASPLSSLGRPQHTPSLRTRCAIIMPQHRDGWACTKLHWWRMYEYCLDVFCIQSVRFGFVVTQSIGAVGECVAIDVELRTFPLASTHQAWTKCNNVNCNGRSRVTCNQCISACWYSNAHATY